MASAVASSVAAAKPVVAQRRAQAPRVAACAGFRAAPLQKKQASFGAAVAQRVARVQVGVAGAGALAPARSRRAAPPFGLPTPG